MKVLFVCFCLLLVGAGVAMAQQQTYVHEHRTGAGVWVPGYYRPYAPGDIYRQRQGVVVIVAVPAKTPPKVETPAMPALRDDSGGWVDGLVKQQATSDKAIDFMRRAGEEKERQLVEEKKKRKL